MRLPIILSLALTCFLGQVYAATQEQPKVTLISTENEDKYEPVGYDVYRLEYKNKQIDIKTDYARTAQSGYGLGVAPKFVNSGIVHCGNNNRVFTYFENNYTANFEMELNDTENIYRVFNEDLTMITGLFMSKIIYSSTKEEVIKTRPITVDFYNKNSQLSALCELPYFIDKIGPKEKVRLLKELKPEDIKHGQNPFQVAVITYLSQYPVDKNNLRYYNDIGFYLSTKMQRDQEALDIYKAVEKISPNRVVLMLNMADSYWAIDEKENALIYYKKYVDLMTKAGKEARIPATVFERLDGVK